MLRHFAAARSFQCSSRAQENWGKLTVDVGTRQGILTRFSSSSLLDCHKLGRPVGPTPGQQCPCDPRHLVGQRDRDDLERSPKLSEPVPYTIALPKWTALHQGRTATGPLTYQQRTLHSTVAPRGPRARYPRSRRHSDRQGRSPSPTETPRHDLGRSGV